LQGNYIKRVTGNALSRTLDKDYVIPNTDRKLPPGRYYFVQFKTNFAYSSDKQREERVRPSTNKRAKFQVEYPMASLSIHSVASPQVMPPP
jgi:hypothetical protein